MKILQTIENISRECRRLAVEDAPPRLMESSFADLSDEQCRVLCGARGVQRWPEFKKALRAYQADMGFFWKSAPGRGGPISLMTVELTAAAGKAFARQLLEENVSEGRLDAVIDDCMTETAKLMRGPGIETNLKDFRTGFTSAHAKNLSYRFYQGRSQRFRAATRVYQYGGKTTSRDREDSLGEALMPWLEKAFDFAKVEHVQSRRQGKRFENADFVGFRIKRGLLDDEFEIFSFELKAKNDVPAISEAISQAVNYRSRSNYTYIILPLFDAAQFHDEARFGEFLTMCRSNGIGALSVSIGSDGKSIVDLVEVQKAEYCELADSDWLLRLVEGSSYEPCPLCRRIVDCESRLRCGWKTGQNGDEFCMKQRFEEGVGVSTSKISRDD